MIKNISLLQLLLTGTRTISDNFHKRSFVKLGGKEIKYKDWPDQWKRVYYKEYPRFERLTLNPVPGLLKQDFIDVLASRRSERDFGGKNITFKELSTLLHFSLGQVNLDENNAEQKKNRFYPSAGARYPTEVYVLLKEGNGVPKNFSFHYNVKRGCLEKLFAFDSYSVILGQRKIEPWIEKSSMMICISSVFARTKVKYGERGYRFSLFEAGHIAQNIYLVATALGLKCCALGGFDDVKANSFLELNTQDEAVLYALVIGK